MSDNTKNNASDNTNTTDNTNNWSYEEGDMNNNNNNNESSFDAKGAAIALTRLAAIVLAGGITMYLLVKFVYPLVKAFLGAILGAVIIMILFVLCGLIEVHTANTVWKGLMALNRSGSEKFWSVYEDLKARKAKRTEKNL